MKPWNEPLQLPIMKSTGPSYDKMDRYLMEDYDDKQAAPTLQKQLHSAPD